MSSEPAPSEPAPSEPSLFISRTNNVPSNTNKLSFICSHPYEEIDTSNKIKKKYVYHNLFKTGTTWPTTTDILCYHCVDQIHGRPPIFLPVEYRVESAEYVGAYLFCSPSCALAYATERQSYNIPMMMTWLVQLAAEMGYPTPICPAPPQMRLKKFGGDMDIDTFRGTSIVIHPIFPPMITWAMVFEERHPIVPPPATTGSDSAIADRATITRIRGLDPIPEEPEIAPLPSNSLYAQFIMKKDNEQDGAPGVAEAQPPLKKSRASKSTNSNLLAFMKRKDGNK